MHNLSAQELAGRLRRRGQLLADGWTPRAIAEAVATGALHRVRRGWYYPADQWSRLWGESRHLAHVLAVNADADAEPPVAALCSAAVILGLPLYSVTPRRVHLLGAPARRRSGDDVFRHECDVDDDDIVEVGGIRCTSPARTVHDLARLASAEVAIAALDAALGRIGGDPRRFDEDAADRWLAALSARARPGMRGIRRAEALFEIADGRAQLPLEAVTTLQLHRLGFARPRLQVPVAGPRGSTFWMDMELAEIGAFYECDGLGKYLDPDLRGVRDTGRVLLDEKSREDWVRGTTGRRVLRGTSADSRTPAALAARLHAFGVALPVSRSRPLLPRLPLEHGV